MRSIDILQKKTNIFQNIFFANMELLQEYLRKKLHLKFRAYVCCNFQIFQLTNYNLIIFLKFTVFMRELLVVYLIIKYELPIRIFRNNSCLYVKIFPADIDLFNSLLLLVESC